MRILIPDAAFTGDPDLERQVLAPVLTEVGSLLEVHRLLEYATVPVDSWRAADAVLLSTDRITVSVETVRLLDRCRVIVRAGSGVENIDAQACAARGIAVCNVPDAGIDDAAGHVLALALALRRGLPTYRDMLDIDPVAGWQWSAAPLVRRIAGQNFGIVGLGAIGRAIAQRAAALGFHVLYFDPDVAPGDAGGCERRPTLDALLDDSDIVSLHCALTSDTRAMIGAAQLARMRPDSILINTAHGALVDIDALPAALRAGRPGGAALDVLPKEPPDPDHELIAAWRLQPTWLAGRLILTPHVASYSPEGMRELRIGAAEILRDALSGQALRNCVNRDLLKPLSR